MASAITNGYYCTIQSRHVKFNSILVVTNQTISNTARETLINGAEKFSFFDIGFQIGEDIVELIDEYLPKFYFYTSGLYAQIATALQDKCKMLGDLKNLPQFSVEERALIDVFVQPRLQYLESKHIEGRRQSNIITETPKTIIPKHRRVLIIGDAGSGKSVILRETVLSQLVMNTRDKTPNLPILLKAHDLVVNTDESFEEILNNVVKRYYGLPEFDIATLGDV